MKPKLHHLLWAIFALLAALWMTYWSGYQSGYVKVKNEQYSTIYLATAEKLHFLKVLGDESNQSLKNDIRLSIKGNVAELESMDAYLQRFDGLHIWGRIYEIPMLAYLASKLHDRNQDRKSMLAALVEKIEKNSGQATK